MSDDDIENEFDTDDFDSDDFDDGGFDDLGDQKGTLGDLWRNNPLVKIGVILAAFAFLVGGVILFGGGSDNLPVSRVAASRDVTEAPGSAETTEAYRQSVEAKNVERTEEAMRTAGSSVPTPVDPPKGTLPLQFEEPEEEDPLERWRRMQEDRIRQQQVESIQETPGVEPPPPEDTRTPAINALAQAMSQQMESVLANQEIKGPILQQVATMGFLENLAEKERLRREAELEARRQALTPEGDDTLDILIPAGTIEYAQLITEANTDAPGPVLAQILTGPLKGGRLIGTFSSTSKFLTLNFNTVVVDGIDYAADSVAIDPDTTLPGVVTEIDNRYLKRVLLPGAAAFIEGLTEAIADSGRTTIEIRNSDGSSSTTTEGTSGTNQEVASGIAEAGEEMGEILDDIADETEPMIRVAAGTPIGVLFVASVIGTPQLIQQREQEEQQRILDQLQITNGTNPISIPDDVNVITP